MRWATMLAMVASALVACSESAVSSDAAPPQRDATRVDDTPPSFDVVDVTDVADVRDGSDVADVRAGSDVADVRDGSDVADVRDGSDVIDAPDVVEAPDVVDAPDVTDTREVTDAPDVIDAPVSCLRVVRDDLAAYVMAAPYATSSGAARMAVVASTSDLWRAGRRAAMAWAADDCAGFADAARAMGYDAVELVDTVRGGRHWVLREPSGSRFNGVFVFAAPAERARARALVIDSPHRGFDFNDDRAVVAYRETRAVAFLQNTAHRCNLDVCSGCSTISNYACGGCVVESDVAHSSNQLYYAVYDGLEAARDDLHFEYHGASAANNAAGCSGTVHLSQASSRDLTPAIDDGTYPNRLWRALESSLGAACVCYHQRETGCQLNGAGSTEGRRTNQEATGAIVDVCTTAPPGLAARFAHFEAYNIPVARVIAALNEAVPAP
jgi:hypothetical protein